MEVIGNHIVEERGTPSALAERRIVMVAVVVTVVAVVIILLVVVIVTIRISLRAESS